MQIYLAALREILTKLPQYNINVFVHLKALKNITFEKLQSSASFQ